jgi:glycine/D-amino acid oxidase-like deaminating enzyme
MSGQDTIAVIGAGIIGTAVAYALAREGRKVLLIDRAAPGTAGASFGNAGHIAAEDQRPLPSPGLLFGFYRELFRYGGTLDLAPRQALRMLPWIRRFAAAAFRRNENTRHFAPLVRPSADKWGHWVKEIGQPALLKRLGHYEVDFGAGGAALLQAHARSMSQLGIESTAMPAEQLQPLQRAANAPTSAGLWFKDSAHVTDPLGAVQALAAAAFARDTTFQQLNVTALQARGDKIEVLGEQSSVLVDAAVVCAGIRSQPLLAPFGLNAPLQAVRGYHVELPAHASMLDAPVVYSRDRIIVTPMAGRLRATSYMEFKEADAPADARKPARLRQKLRALGYACDSEGRSWLGARPVLPDYLPGIGRAPGAVKLLYAIGHQHLGLTLAPITGELIADLVALRTPQISVAAFDLRRFGAHVP